MDVSRKVRELVSQVWDKSRLPASNYVVCEVGNFLASAESGESVLGSQLIPEIISAHTRGYNTLLGSWQNIDKYGKSPKTSL